MNSYKNKKHLKAKKNLKESLQYFHITVILMGSVYGIDENYYPKCFLKNLFITFFGEI